MQACLDTLALPPPLAAAVASLAAAADQALQDTVSVGREGREGGGECGKGRALLRVLGANRAQAASLPPPRSRDRRRPPRPPHPPHIAR